MPTDLGDDAVSTLILGGTVSSVGGKDILSFENVDLSDGDFLPLEGMYKRLLREVFLQA